MEEKPEDYFKDGKYYCSKCDITLSDKGGMKRHLKSIIHTTSKKYVPFNKMYFDTTCPICGEEFARAESLKRHHLYKHTTEEEYKAQCKFNCTICDKYYYIQSLLNAHLKTEKHLKKVIELNNLT